MSTATPVVRQSFRVHVMRLHGPEQELTVRILIVETLHGHPIYEGYGSWPQCEHWMAQLSGWLIRRDELIQVRKRVEQDRMATIKQIKTSLCEMESLGLLRVDS
jgi:hypothetical protein